MKLIDVSNGSLIGVYVIGIIFLIVGLLIRFKYVITFIAGFNTMSKEERAKYDIEKVCKGFGRGIIFMSVILILAAIFAKLLPWWTEYVLLGIFVVDIVVMLIMGAQAKKTE